jgi:hypothetical protein
MNDPVEVPDDERTSRLPSCDVPVEYQAELAVYRPVRVGDSDYD